ncbi:hypothetical protein E2C01_033919 [Portunus trituberculatus]|uniref:Uncharacterized protein n=1 Tax=Portunus trituberculatus TaxID=210409 RepID=A0A5B7F5I9_PORTR|nr:hypothetical protein [Portunus trituberculatus]
MYSEYIERVGVEGRYWGGCGEDRIGLDKWDRIEGEEGKGSPPHLLLPIAHTPLTSPSFSSSSSSPPHMRSQFPNHDFRGE